MVIIGNLYEHNAIFRHLNLYVNDIKELERVLQLYPKEHKIVCWMMTNNITGTCFPVEYIGKLCHKYGAYYIMDAVATIGHYPIPENLESFCDCLVTSGHKYYAEKGLGFMWVSDRFAKFLGLSNDSHEEYSLIRGTPNTGGAIALSYAVKHAVENVEKNSKKFEYLAKCLTFKLIKNCIANKIFGYEETKTHAINALYLPNLNADSLVQYLSSQNIFVSPCYSACSNEANYRTAEALGMTREQASQTIRVSFCEDTTEEHIDKLVNGIVKFKELFI